MSPVLRASVELDCYRCSLKIRIGDPIELGRYGWVHALCAEDGK